jgi:hypothetical protein
MPKFNDGAISTWANKASEWLGMRLPKPEENTASKTRTEHFADGHGGAGGAGSSLEELSGLVDVLHKWEKGKADIRVGEAAGHAETANKNRIANLEVHPENGIKLSTHTPEPKTPKSEKVARAAKAVGTVADVATTVMGGPGGAAAKTAAKAVAKKVAAKAVAKKATTTATAKVAKTTAVKTATKAAAKKVAKA